VDLLFPEPGVFYDARRKSWFKQMPTEVTAFRDALEVCLYEMPRHPATKWHDKFDRFVADQAAAGRELTPESKGMPRIVTSARETSSRRGRRAKVVGSA